MYRQSMRRNVVLALVLAAALAAGSRLHRIIKPVPS
jgi:hypothetical protein